MATAAQKAFVKEVFALAKDATAQGAAINPQAMVAQAILESAFGTSSLAKQANNLFGITKGSWTGSTHQAPGGTLYRKYSDRPACVANYCVVIKAPRYRQARTVRHDPEAYIRALADHWAQDPLYASKLIQVLHQWQGEMLVSGNDSSAGNRKYLVDRELARLRSSPEVNDGEPDNILDFLTRDQSVIRVSGGDQDDWWGVRHGDPPDPVVEGFMQPADLRPATASASTQPQARATPLGPVVPVAFPGRIVSKGETDSDIVKALQARLAAVGLPSKDPAGVFDEDTEKKVWLFQFRYLGPRGENLPLTGKVDVATWGALFGERSVPASRAPATPLIDRMLVLARAEIGVRENPLGSNRGARVDEYVSSVGLTPGAADHPWCAAFVCFCFKQAAKDLSVANPAESTAGVHTYWTRAKASAKNNIVVTARNARKDPALVKAGMLFLADRGGGNGHMGIIESVQGDTLTTIEGNTNDGGSREGIGVFKRSGRKIADISLGFIGHWTV